MLCRNYKISSNYSKKILEDLGRTTDREIAQKFNAPIFGEYYTDNSNASLLITVEGKDYQTMDCLLRSLSLP